MLEGIADRRHRRPVSRAPGRWRSSGATCATASSRSPSSPTRSCSPPGSIPRCCADPALRAGAKGVLDGRRPLRRRLLRLHAARGRADGPAAPRLPGVRLGGAGGRRLRSRPLPGRVGVFAGSGTSAYLSPTCCPTRSGLAKRRRPPGAAPQRPRLPGHPHLLQARPQGAERRRADRLLDLAGGRPHGLPEPARRASATWRWPAACRSACRCRTGYLYQEGSVISPDGHCRAFDAAAPAARSRATAPAWWCSSAWPTPWPTATASTP